MAQKINLEGPSYKAGYKAGYEAAQAAVHSAQQDAEDAYQRGQKDALAHARIKWTERMAELRAEGLLRELATIDA